jgi:excinuclease ABC subunit B
MNKFKLVSNFSPTGDQPKAIEKLSQGIEKGFKYQTLQGVTGSGKTFTVANLIKKFNKPVLVIAPNKSLAAQLYREYKNFFPKNSVNFFVSYYDYYQPEAYMPVTDTYIEKEAMINEEIDRLRHEATSSLISRKDVIVVASVSCIYNLGLPANYLTSSLHLEIGKDITRGDLIRQLVKLQFTRTNVSLKRSTFRVRGDILEIMPATGEKYFRIVIENQKIAKIFIIEEVTAEIVEEPLDIIIFPSKHFISSEPEIEIAIKEIKNELSERLEYFKKNKLYLEAERLKRRTKYDMEMLKTLGFCHGIENYSRVLSGKIAGEPPETLLSYFPKNKKGEPNFLTIVDESHIAVPQLRGMYQGDKSRKQTLVKYGWRLPSALDNRPLRFEELVKNWGQVIFTTATPGDFEKENSSAIVEQVIRPTGLIDPPIQIRPVFGPSTSSGQVNQKNQVQDIIEEIEKVTKKNQRVIVNTLTKKMAEDLSEYLESRGIRNRYLHSDIKTIQRTDILKEFRLGEFEVLVGVNLLREGLDLPEVALVAIMDADREGFLRSKTSLIQTMGRASRNVTGYVILYADQITDSIKYAVEEVERRRKVQLKYNKKHGITPKTIHKKIEDMLQIEEGQESRDLSLESRIKNYGLSRAVHSGRSGGKSREKSRKSLKSIGRKIIKIKNRN